MFTGTPEELEARNREAQQLAEEIAVRLNRLAQLGPFFVDRNRIGYPGGMLLTRAGAWIADPN